LKIDGFFLDVHKEGFSFTRAEGDVTYQFGGNFRFGTDVIYCDYFNAGLRFNQVEEFLTPILVESDILGSNAEAKSRWTLGIKNNSLFGKSDNSLQGKVDLEIRTNNDIQSFASAIINYYTNAADPFFSDWSSLMDFKDLLDDLNPRETAQIFGTGGIFKKAVIYKMVNHKVYNEYIDKTIQNLLAAKESNPEEVQYQRFYRAALLTKEKLASRDLPS
jgi:hypothetical protein